ncbi:hypothetical protein SESBI_46157 [Sesbania bispinosa]|nr:hypothetical protein SESBI_46157 [Sesbania bispinosa]
MALVSTGFHAIKDICGRRENWRLKGGTIEATVQKHYMHRTVIPFMGLSLLKSNEIKRHPRLLSNVVWGPIRCAIFGDLVDTVHGFMALPRHGLLVMIIQTCSSEVGIQNLMNASKLLWNPDIPEAISFKERMEISYYWALSLKSLKVELGGTMLALVCELVNFDGGPPYCDECQMEVYDMSPRYKV